MSENSTGYAEQVDEVYEPSDNVKNKRIKFEFQYIEEPSPSCYTSQGGQSFVSQDAQASG